MPESYSTRPQRCRPFIVTPYIPDGEGRLVAQMPSCCPWSSGAAGPACRLVVDHSRARKTGPRHPLTVAACSTHGHAFTLYPPGFAPYLRQPVLRLGPGGESIPGDGPGGLTDTIFEAAVAAKTGCAWARSSDGEDPPPERYWGTQGRHLDFASRLLGVARDLADGVRESIAAMLSVSMLRLRELSRARGYRAIGEAVCDVLARLRRGPRRADQLLVCAHLVGQWGPPWRWNALRAVIERSPFSDEGTSSGSSP